MLARDYYAKMYAEHPGLEEQVKEVERLYGAPPTDKALVIWALLKGRTPEDIAADDALMDI